MFILVVYMLSVIQALESFCKISKCVFMQVLQAMVQMGVLVPTGDMTAVRRTAQFFLDR
jgi:hypothetical protein